LLAPKSWSPAKAWRASSIGFIDRSSACTCAFWLVHAPPLVVMVACAASLGSCTQLIKHVPTGFVPVDDQGQFEVDVRTPKARARTRRR